jgi:uncharacterized membrane protein YfcA
MNLAGFIISLVVFLFTAKLTYEVWFVPQRFSKRLEAQRNSFTTLFGFSYWKNGYVNWSLARVMSIFILLISFIGIIVSITGPIIIRR